LEAVTSLVIDWRRIELKSWNRLLDDTRVRKGANPPKWWFYIYQLIEDCLEKTKTGIQCCYIIASVKSRRFELNLVRAFGFQSEKNGDVERVFGANKNYLQNFYRSHLTRKLLKRAVTT